MWITKIAPRNQLRMGLPQYIKGIQMGSDFIVEIRRLPEPLLRDAA
jgi:hypothetical protein